MTQAQKVFLTHMHTKEQIPVNKWSYCVPREGKETGHTSDRTNTKDETDREQRTPRGYIVYQKTLASYFSMAALEVTANCGLF